MNREGGMVGGMDDEWEREDFIRERRLDWVGWDGRLGRRWAA